jgi:hypothetical protein
VARRLLRRRPRSLDPKVRPVSAADLLDGALSPSPGLQVVHALKRWAAAERAVIEANELPFEVNRKLPEQARELAAASEALLAAVDALEGR